MLDSSTLRLAFGIVAVTVFSLLSLISWRGDRSTYATWWQRTLLLFIIGDLFFIGDGTGAQRFTNPFGDLFVVAGAAAAWCCARSLHGGRPAGWQLAAGPAAAFLAAELDHPDRSSWAGGPVFLGTMAIYFALASWDARRAVRPARRQAADRTYQTLVTALAAALGVLALFYAGRTVAMLAWGSSSTVFNTWLGSGPASLVQLVLMVIVAFSMSSLTSEQKLRELQVRASRDPLTGLLNRGEFCRVAEERIAAARRNGSSCVLVMGDLDRFKSINDRLGHAGGDSVLRAFAQACVAVLRPDDLVGRYGGEEFMILVGGASPGDVEGLTRRISEHFQSLSRDLGVRPTASYGIAPLEGALALEDLLGRADRALYCAKENGRDQAAHYRG